MDKCSLPILDLKFLDGDSGEFEGYASTFGGEPDAVGDIVEPGAFTASISAHKARNTMPKMFWMHDRAEVIGKWTDVYEDSKGLRVKGRLNMGVQRAREAYALLKERDIDGLSIGYSIRRYETDAETGVWFLKELDLNEVSVVSIGANPHATISNVKAARAASEIMNRFKAGDRLTEREFETVLKGTLGFSNSQAERAARVHLKGQGEPAEADDEAAFWAAMAG